MRPSPCRHPPAASRGNRSGSKYCLASHHADPQRLVFTSRIVLPPRRVRLENPSQFQPLASIEARLRHGWNRFPEPFLRVVITKDFERTKYLKRAPVGNCSTWRTRSETTRKESRRQSRLSLLCSRRCSSSRRPSSP